MSVARSAPPAGRIPTLDGVRAISIGLVLVAHAIGTGVIPMNARAAHVLGDVGVRSFFVLSGFLITSLLVREHARHGRISLGAFYMRRSLRIFPAFYAYLAVVAGLAAAGAVTLSPGDLAAAASYTMNFHADRSWATGHLWSLAVEEQFYLVWPILIALLGCVRAWSFAVAAIVLAPVIRLAVYHGAPEQRALVDQAFPCVFDALATGCLLALARPRLAASARCQRLLDARWFPVVPAGCLGALVVTRPWFQFGVAMTLANLGIALVILFCVSRPTGRLGRVLERPTLVWIGTLSYSLYLWQQLFLNRHGSALIHAFPINLALAFAAAIACHYLLERPILRLSARFRDRPAQVPVLAVPGLLSTDRVLVIDRPTRRRRPDAPSVPGTIPVLRDDDRPD